MSVIDAYLDALWLEQGASDHTLAAYRRDLTAWQEQLERDDETLLTASPRAVWRLDGAAPRAGIPAAQQCTDVVVATQFLSLGTTVWSYRQRPAGQRV
ncbi:hypothetical protein DK37_28010, partial [Halomonas sp. SUBG004]